MLRRTCFSNAVYPQLSRRVASNKSSTSISALRTMSTATSQWADGVPQKYFTYLVVLPDLPNSKRAELRQQHLEGASVGSKNGRVVDGAAYYNVDPATAGRDLDVKDMGGSYQIVRAASAQEVREKFAQDIYATGGAWDLSKLQIFPIINKPL